MTRVLLPSEVQMELRKYKTGIPVSFRMQKKCTHKNCNRLLNNNGISLIFQVLQDELMEEVTP
jgi:hypothetical protein